MTVFRKNLSIKRSHQAQVCVVSSKQYGYVRVSLLLPTMETTRRITPQSVLDQAVFSQSIQILSSTRVSISPTSVYEQKEMFHCVIQGKTNQQTNKQTNKQTKRKKTRTSDVGKKSFTGRRD